MADGPAVSPAGGDSAEFSMSMGPGRNQWCCGKPVGCTMVSGMDPEDPGACSYLNHRWKLDNIAGHRERMAARLADRAGQAGRAAS